MVRRAVKDERASETRELIMTAAEQLFAERGVLAVSNRQVGEAAGQGNNFAVGYHFGSKTELVRAIVRKHDGPMERLRQQMLAQTRNSSDVRDWVSCLVRPFTDHLAALGSPTWYARFSAQVMTDPTLRTIVVEESLRAPSLQQVLDQLFPLLPALPDEVWVERADMARHLIAHTCAERERALAEGAPTPRATWADAASGLIDALVGLWLAPVSAGR